MRIREVLKGEDGELREVVNRYETTVGRALLSEILPAGLPFPLINKPLKKKEISKLINEAFRRCGIRETVIFADKRPDPVYPRWVAYFLVWCAIGFLPATGLAFFYDGPFAWNGLLSFWLAATLFGSFFLVLSWATLRAIKSQFAPDGPDSPDAETADPALQTA